MYAIIIKWLSQFVIASLVESMFKNALSLFTGGKMKTTLISVVVIALMGGGLYFGKNYYDGKMAEYKILQEKYKTSIKTIEKIREDMSQQANLINHLNSKNKNIEGKFNKRVAEIGNLKRQIEVSEKIIIENPDDMTHEIEIRFQDVFDNISCLTGNISECKK